MSLATNTAWLQAAADKVASVYAYAVATYDPPPTPGANPAAVTDAYIRAAVAAARGSNPIP